MPTTDGDAAPAATPSPVPATWSFSAAVATWVAPGLGHALLGERRRGLVIGVTILSLWLAGLFIGGVGAIDRQRHPWWFLGQMLVGPSLVVNYTRTTFMAESTPPGRATPTGGPALTYEPSHSHPNEQGVLYTALAGLLNLLAMIDVLYREPARPGRGDAPAPPSPAGAAG